VSQTGEGSILANRYRLSRHTCILYMYCVQALTRHSFIGPEACRSVVRRFSYAYISFSLLDMQFANIEYFFISGTLAHITA